ncbi:MAG: GNAT family N-acetyltransferase [bacterium]
MLVGRLVQLTPLRAADAEAMLAWINDREEVLLNAPYRPVSEAQHAAWFETVQRDRETVIFGIRALHEERLLGYCQLVNIHWIHRTAELRIRLGEEKDRGRGYGSEVIRQLVDFAFRDLSLNRVHVHVFATNERALRVYEKLGFVQEGLLRAAAHIDGEYVDVIIMGILRDRHAPR